MPNQRNEDPTGWRPRKSGLHPPGQKRWVLGTTKNVLPSGKRLHSYWKWWFIVDLPINSMVIFHSYVNVYQAGYIPRNPQVQLRQVTSPSFPRRKGSTSPMSGGWKTCHLRWKKLSPEIAWSADWCLVGNGWEWTGMDGNGWEWDYW